MSKKWKKKNPLRSFRSESGLSRSGIAAALGVSLPTIQNWENGTTTPNDEHMRALAGLMQRDKKDVEFDWTLWKSRAARAIAPLIMLFPYARILMGV